MSPKEYLSKHRGKVQAALEIVLSSPDGIDDDDINEWKEALKDLQTVSRGGSR